MADSSLAKPAAAQADDLLSLFDNGANRRNPRFLLRLWPWMRPYQLRLFCASFALICSAAIMIALGQGLAYLVDRGLSAGDRAVLDRALLILLGISLLLALFSFLRFYLVSWLGERLVADLRRSVFSHLLRFDVGFFEIYKTGDLLSRMTADLTILQTTIGSSVPIVLRHGLMLIGAVLMLFVTSPSLGLYVLLAVPCVILPILLFGRQVRRLSRESQARVADLGSDLDETLYGIRAVKAFTQDAQMRARFTRAVEAAFSAAQRRILARASLTGLVILIVFSSVGGILWLGGRSVISGEMSAGELSAFIFYAVLVAGATGALSDVIGEIQRAAGATERLFELLDVQPQITAPAHPVPLPQPVTGRLDFESVRFTYPARPEQPALQDFSVTINPGQRVALVGPSGAGKTTLLALLLRFYDVSAGVIRLDGIDLRDLDPADLRAQLAYVPQDPILFSGTVAQNLRFGQPQAQEEEIIAAAQAAHADDFIRHLPQGYETQLGERGVRLSGGQRQRIAIARALLRDPKILLLDEATSALDAESEALVQAGLERLMQGRTSLIIAHRLATIRHADHILVLDHGRLIEQGTHENLIRNGHLYAHLAALQFD